MNRQLNRRQFTVGSTFAASALVLGGFAQAEHLESEETDLRLVELGINALARAPEMSYFADGHRGASMISAHLMCVNNNFEPAARQRIGELFDLNWAKSKLCQDFPEGDAVDNAVKLVGEALAGGGETLREVGHDAIFAMHAIKAFEMVPSLATRERVEGVCNLIKAIKPWRDDKPDESVDPPPFADTAAISAFILKEASDAIDRFKGYGQGFAGHMLTFGQSLVELAAMGYEEWAEACRPAFRKYVTVTRKGPQSDDRKIKDHGFSKLRPADTEYWRKRGDKSLGIGHVFKYPYAYYDLVKRSNATVLEGEFEAKAWHLF